MITIIILNILLISDVHCIFGQAMSWHNPRSPDSTSCHAPGPGSQPELATCRLCPEPGLVPASLLSDHLSRDHPGLAFECAACKVRKETPLGMAPSYIVVAMLRSWKPFHSPLEPCPMNMNGYIRPDSGFHSLRNSESHNCLKNYSIGIFQRFWTNYKFCQSMFLWNSDVFGDWKPQWDLM